MCARGRGARNGANSGTLFSYFLTVCEKLGKHFELLLHCSNYSLFCLHRCSAEDPPHYSVLPQWNLLSSVRSFKISVSINEPSVPRGNTAAAGVVLEPPASGKLRPASFVWTYAGFRDPDPVDSSQVRGVPPCVRSWAPTLTGGFGERFIPQ